MILSKMVAGLSSPYVLWPGPATLEVILTSPPRCPPLMTSWKFHLLPTHRHWLPCWALLPSAPTSAPPDPHHELPSNTKAWPCHSPGWNCSLAPNTYNSNIRIFTLIHSRSLAPMYITYIHTHTYVSETSFTKSYPAFHTQYNRIFSSLIYFIF